MKNAKCEEMKLDWIALGYTKYTCSKQSPLADKENPLLTEDFFTIAFNRVTGKYAAPVPPDAYPICADSSVLLLTASRD